MTQRHIAIILGARPNVPKVWTLLRALHNFSNITQINQIKTTVIHSGQHYHALLGTEFANALNVHVDINLEVGPSKSDGDQLGRIMTAINNTLQRIQPDYVVVVGDVNTSLAAALTTARQGIPLIHLEAGLRSRVQDAEEVNRKVITSCSNYHLTPSRLATSNLLGEGVDPQTIFTIGNTMAEAFLSHKSLRTRSTILENLGLEEHKYVLFTVHKSGNLKKLAWFVQLLQKLVADFLVVFPCHPHTYQHLQHMFPEVFSLKNIIITDPLPYIDFGRLIEKCFCAVTDSAGTQEECVLAENPCVTVGIETARPETILYGTNNYVGYDIDLCLKLVKEPPSKKLVPPLWDTRVSQRIQQAFIGILHSDYLKNVEEVI